MTTVSAVLSRCARECSIDEPGTWVGTTEEDAVALRDDFMFQAANNIMDRLDLPSPIGKQVAITGADTYTSGSGYALPSNFRRLQRDKLAVYETSPSRRICTPVSDDGEWTHIQEVGLGGVSRFFRLTGYEGAWYIDFYNTLSAATDSVTVSYVSENWMVIPSSGQEKSTFNSDLTETMLPRKALEAGIIYLFRKRNGLEYRDVQREYEFEMERLSNDRRTRRSIRMGDGSRILSPWDIPVPDFIPSS